MRRTGAAATVAALALTGITGCGPSAGEAPAGGTVTRGPAASAGAAASASPAVRQDPREALTMAGRKLGEQSVRVTLEAGKAMSASGVLDPAARKADMRMEIEKMTFHVIGIGGDVYFKGSGELAEVLGDGWQRVQRSKLPPGSSLDLMPDGDPAGANNLMKGVVEVHSVGPGRFAGTLDATKSPSADKKALAAFGDKAKNVPFTADVDAQGRLVHLVLDMSTLSPLMPKMVTRYTDFGAPVTVTKPAKFTDLPPDMVRLLK